MNAQVEEIREGIMESLGRITVFWGFGKVMGQLYGLLYVSPGALTLDEMARNLSISKGNASINIRALERWNMVKRIWVKGDRKDYYEAETDFWKIIKGVLREREKKEFDQALDSVRGMLNKLEIVHKKEKTSESAFLKGRINRLHDFISTMDKLVGFFLSLEDVRQNFFKIPKKKEK